MLFVHMNCCGSPSRMFHIKLGSSFIFRLICKMTKIYIRLHCPDLVNYMCHLCTKGFLDSNLDIDKISNFQKHYLKFHILTKIVYKWNFLDQLLLHDKFHGSGMKVIIFLFNFASCELLKHR